MSPAQSDALKKAWRSKQNREARRFAQVVCALSGVPVDEIVPPIEGDQPQAL